MRDRNPLIRYPPEINPGESREDYHRRALNEWRNREKARLFLERGWICEREGCQRGAEQLDEAIVPRCDARGLSLEQYRLIFVNVNLALLCAQCNTARAHDRAGAWERACNRYGRESMYRWYASLGLRAPRREWINDSSSRA